MGTTHVAVGFVDLGMLLAADLGSPPSILCSGPLTFLGIDLSAYTVAKTLVVWEMIKQTPNKDPIQREAQMRYVAQVWYSTTLEGGAFERMKNALRSLCSSNKAYNSNVSEILEHWAAAARFPLKKAREAFSDDATTNRSFIGHFVRKCDRIAMGRYEISGDFCLKGEPMCGNTIMFDCPDGTAPLEKDETVFSALSFREIMDILKADETAQMDIVGAAETYALGGISKIVNWALSGRLDVELFCSPFESVIDEIAARKPWTMSWSNVLDYIDYGDFHRMARACSVHGDTIHYGYSMNWCADVLGVNIIDFTRSKEQAAIRKQLIDGANDCVEKTYGYFGWKRYLRLPPPTNPINTVSSFGLDSLHYKKWADQFFEIARRGGDPCNVANVEYRIAGSPMSPTGSSTVYLTWTYDPEITFRNLEFMNMMQSLSRMGLM